MRRGAAEYSSGEKLGCSLHELVYSATTLMSAL